MINHINHIAILGSTGSIGTQALQVIEQHKELFKVHVLTAQNNAGLLIAQCLKFNPAYAVICNEEKFPEVKAALAHTSTTVLAGYDSVKNIVTDSSIDLLITAMVGFAGLEPTINAIKAGKDIALANKETLVVAGELITALAQKHRVKLLPVDSEHSAIFQCLAGEENNPIEKIIITASGGPFYGKNISQLFDVSPQDALKHPNWSMGNKITIDSATLMNKGLEVIEAKWLFDLKLDQIDVVVHPQSIIHSMVQFQDGSIKAQMGLPDMKLPIQYALTYPARIKNNFKRFDFTAYPNLTFDKPDTKTFRNLNIAYVALNKGGNSPCVINAANEVAVEGFLNHETGFLAMSDIIETCLEKMPFIKEPNLDDYLNTDKQTRIFARELLQKMPKALTH